MVELPPRPLESPLVDVAAGENLAQHVVNRFVPCVPIAILGDDTVTQHPGKHFYGNGRHRDAARPHATTVVRDAAWFPRRKFAFADDCGYGTHALTRFVFGQPRLTLISKFYKDANLYDLPPKRQPGTNGRREVAIVTCTAHWYKGGTGLVPVRWVFVEDRTGTHRDEYFFTTDIVLTPPQIIEAYTGRWAIEVTFEEVREHVGLETTRGRCARTILRAEPCLFGLYTLVTLWFAELPEKERQEPVVTWMTASSRR